jgi:putative transcriptional regulator
MSNDVKLLRFLAQDMTQADLGKRVGLTRQTIAAIEQGCYSPSLDVAFHIAPLPSSATLHDEPHLDDGME